MNIWLALGAWIGVSVPVSLALGILIGHTKEAARRRHAADPVTLPSVPGGRLSRV